MSKHSLNSLVDSELLFEGFDGIFRFEQAALLCRLIDSNGIDLVTATQRFDNAIRHSRDDSRNGLSCSGGHHERCVTILASNGSGTRRGTAMAA